MTIKSILHIFGGAPKELNALNVAFDLGKLHQAHIRFLHISTDPSAYLYPLEIMREVQIVKGIEKGNKLRLAQAKRHVRDFASRAGVPLDDADASNCASAQFIHLTGLPHDLVAQEGRLSDLVIISRGISPDNPAHEPAVLAALFSTGRPLLLLPVMRERAHVLWQGKSAMLAWNSSLEAMRAIHNALPYLKRAKEIYIFHSYEHEETNIVAPLESFIDYLKTHGIRIADIVSIGCGQHSISEVLLDQAKQLRVDLLVMGAYGHNRYREMLLGGVTNDMLANANIPLLLSH
jgi:nucleotide-binding universal stress UspA family protein